MLVPGFGFHACLSLRQGRSLASCSGEEDTKSLWPSSPAVSQASPQPLQQVRKEGPRVAACGRGAMGPIL